MGTDLFPHKSGLGFMEPVALVEQNVCVLYSNTRHYRKVKWMEQIPPFQFLNIGAVAANAVSPRTQALNLQAWDNEFLQIRWFPLDHAQIRLFLPNASGRSSLRNIQVPYDPNIVYRDPCLHLTEMYIWEDRNPAFEAINYGAYGLTQCRLIGMGYRFVTEALTKETIEAIIKQMVPCTYLVASGFTGLT